MPTTGRLDRLPDVDERVADDERVLAGDLLGDPRLLGAPHQVVDQHAEPPSRRRTELPHDRGQVVDAVQRLDDDALDRAGRGPRPSRPARRRACPRRRCGPRGRPGPGRRRRTSSPRRCASGRTAPACFGRTRTTGRPSTQKPGPERVAADACRSGPRGGRRPSRSARPRRRSRSSGPRRRGPSRPRPRHRLLDGARVDEVVVRRAGRHPPTLSRRRRRIRGRRAGAATATRPGGRRRVARPRRADSRSRTRTRVVRHPLAP